jgi:hypothetical protein
MSDWHPDAKRVVYSDIPFVSGAPRRLVWHTTEGYGLPRYSGSNPHFTINPKTGDLWQHCPISRSAKALVNASGGVNTNTQGSIQVEIIGFAKDTGGWPASYYDELADLARWIERNAGVKRACSVTFSNTPSRMSYSKWLDYDGHCGHQHVPENIHWDPGAFRIEEVLNLSAAPYRTLDAQENGPDVVAYQRAINRVATNCCRPERKVTVDGQMGPETFSDGIWAAYAMGLSDSLDTLRDTGITVYCQKRVRLMEPLTDAEDQRRATRRAAGVSDC